MSVTVVTVSGCPVRPVTPPGRLDLERSSVRRSGAFQRPSISSVAAFVVLGLSGVIGDQNTPLIPRSAGEGPWIGGRGVPRSAGEGSLDRRAGSLDRRG